MRNQFHLILDDGFIEAMEQRIGTVFFCQSSAHQPVNPIIIEILKAFWD